MYKNLSPGPLCMLLLLLNNSSSSFKLQVFILSISYTLSKQFIETTHLVPDNSLDLGMFSFVFSILHDSDVAPLATGPWSALKLVTTFDNPICSLNTSWPIFRGHTQFPERSVPC